MGSFLSVEWCDFVDGPEWQQQLLPTSHLWECAKCRLGECMMEWKGLPRLIFKKKTRAAPPL